MTNEAPRADLQDPNSTRPAQSTDPAPSWLFNLVLASAACLGLAGLVIVADHPGAVLSTLGQMVTPWILTGALVGGLSRRGWKVATALGGATLVAANTIYSAATLARYGVLSARHFMVWTVAGLVTGVVAAAVGRVARQGTPREQVVAVAALAATGMAEGWTLWTHIDHPEAHRTYLLVALACLALPGILLRRRKMSVIVAATALAVGLAVSARWPLEVVLQVLGVV